MRRIYWEAFKTYLWLGEASDDSDTAMDFLITARKEDFEEPNFSANAARWKALNTLFERPWWTRLWIVQEALLSGNPILRCGNKEVPLDRKSVV